MANDKVLAQMAQHSFHTQQLSGSCLHYPQNLSLSLKLWSCDQHKNVSVIISIIIQLDTYSSCNW